MQNRRGAAAVIGQTPGHEATAVQAVGRRPEVGMSREPEDLPVEFNMLTRPEPGGRSLDRVLISLRRKRRPHGIYPH